MTIGLHLTAFGHIRGKHCTKQSSKQTSKKTDFSVDLKWWGLLRLTQLISCSGIGLS